MGMFDYIRCEMPLPSIPDGLIKSWGSIDEIYFQTKDTESQGMVLYIINSEGELYRRDQELEWVSDPDGDPILKGHTEVVSQTLVDCPFTGDISFYESYKHPEYESDFGSPSRFQSGWIEYKAIFVKGKLHGDIELIEYRPPVKFTDEEMNEAAIRYEENRKQFRQQCISLRREFPSADQKLIDTIYKLANDNTEITSLIDEYRKLYDTYYEEAN